METFYNFHFQHRAAVHLLLNLFVSGIILFLNNYNAFAQVKEWDMTIGGNRAETLSSHQQTSDGGFILGGYTTSGNSGDKTQASRGGSDFWIVKLDAAGNKLWDKTYGGNRGDILMAIQQTADGGYIVGGYSESGNSRDKTQESWGNFDYWILKLDAAGNKLWDKSYGGDKWDILTSLQQTSDGGYILGGYSDSGISGDKSQATKGEFDYWIIKIDALGNKQWDRTYGGNYRDLLASIKQTTDGGFILGGSSESEISGDKSEPNRSGRDNFDYWIVKVDAAGLKQWDRTYGAEAWEILSDVKQTSDGGYIVGGTSNSGRGDDKTEENRSSPEHYRGDYWVLKLDQNGSKVWDKSIGGEEEDNLTSIWETVDGGYILGGSSRSGKSGDKTEPNRGTVDMDTDYWIVKLDAASNLLWDKTYGGNLNDELFSLQQTSDGGYSLAGSSNSGISGDKSHISRGESDYWIIKLSPETACVPPTPVINLVASSTVYTGGDPSRIYLGYGPQSVQLVASGGTSYTWSPAVGLSSTTVANPVFTPASPGSYTFTVLVSEGVCTASASVTITVIDVRCGNGKVLLCHNGQEICIAPAAVARHLRQHADDRLGACQTPTPTTNTKLRVHPNPFSNRAQADFTLAMDGNYRLELYNAGGKMLGVVAKGKAKAGEEVRVAVGGEKLQEGVYYLKLITPDEVQTTRLILKH